MTSRRKRLRNAALIVALPILLAFAISTGLSKWHWGYFVKRPSVDRWFSRVSQIRSLGEFLAHGDRKLLAVNQAPIQIPEDVQLGRAHQEYPHYYLHERVLERLLEAMPDVGRPALPTKDMATAALDLLYKHALAEHPVLAEREPMVLSGMVGELVDRDGRTRFVVAGSVGFVSNDHVIYQEMLVDSLDANAKPSRTRFYYDMAGIEGTEWYHVFPFLLAPLMLLALPFVVVVAVTLRGDRRRRCVRCAHVLDPGNSGLCPECGTPFEIGSRSTTASGGAAGWLKRRYLKGPGWISGLLAVIAGVLLGSDASLPGGWSLGRRVGVCLLVSLALLTSLRMASSLRSARYFSHAQNRWPIRWRAFVMMFAALIGVGSMVVTDWPLRARWALSRSAFERAVASGSTFPRGPMIPRWLGLYKVNHSVTFDLQWPGSPYYFGVTSGAFAYRNGFLYSPSSPVSIPDSDRDRATVRDLGHGWYVVRVTWRAGSTRP